LKSSASCQEVETATDDLIAIGEMAERSGVAASALRFYESIGLIRSERTPGGHRLFHRSMLRRVAFVRIAQRLGLSLEEIGEALATLPADRTPTRAQWAKLSRSWRGRLDERIAALEGLRDDLTDCIGCGCLSLQRCRLYNPDDAAATLGAGPRYLLGDEPTDVTNGLPRS
jgi:MerR family transcriptional regulator, redox-sensitive transcriptional activator SoxR